MAQVLLERESDLGLLVELVTSLVEHGAGGVAVIEGPPGAGKTRLLEAAREHALTRGANVLTAHGSELEHELTFGGVRQLLAPAIARLDPGLRTEVLRGPAAAAGSILGISEDLAPAAGEPLFALSALVSNLAEEQPVVLAVDDVQWLDAVSSRFLAYLARRVEGQRIVLLCARRPQAGPDPSIELGSASTTTLIRPRPLSVEGVGRLLDEVLGAPVGPEVAAASARVTGGNPFLVVEVARELAEHPEAMPSGQIDGLAPASIGAAVLRRIKRLPEPAPTLASAVALFPDGTTLADAAAVAGIPEAKAAGAADALIAAHVLARSDRLAFEHPVMRTAVYEQLGRHGRRVGHARAADVLVARDADVEEIAAHVLATEPSGSADRVAILQEAAARAERTGAAVAAVRYLARALDEPPPDDQWVGLAHRMGRLQAQAGSSDAVATLRRALERAPVTERVQIAIDLATVLNVVGEYDEAVSRLLEVRAAAGHDREQQLIVEALLSRIAWASKSYGGLYAEVADGLPADLPGSTPGERLALAQVGARMFDRGESHRATGAVLLRSLGQDGSPLVVWNFELGDTVILLVHCGWLDEAGAFCRRRQDLARTTGRDADYLMSLTGITLIDWARGDLAGCEASLRLGMELPGGYAADRAVLVALLSRVCMAKGAYEEARLLLDEATSTAGLSISIPWRRGELEMAMGRPADAVARFEEAYELHEGRGTLNPAETIWQADFAEALAAIGRRTQALEILAEFMRRARSFGEPQALGVGHLALGRVIGGDRGLEDLEQAAGILEPTPYRLAAARAHLALGAALRRGNNRTEASHHLRLALDYADRNGAEPLATRAHEELLAAGGRPRRRALVGVNALTPSEARIARLAADGMTNRDIATHLFVTVKTVEMHLGRSFEKLGVASRRELAPVLRN
ncbi:MAG TPA: AAA family ATPase [Candidatus Limnocylindrales bacterium]|nr:AAA family ATPase [Candidatus Limnocylindrales bacterium]